MLIRKMPASVRVVRAFNGLFGSVIDGPFERLFSPLNSLTTPTTPQYLPTLGALLEGLISM